MTGRTEFAVGFIQKELSSGTVSIMARCTVTALDRAVNEHARLHLLIQLFMAFKTGETLVICQTVLIRIVTGMALITLTACNRFMKERTFCHTELCVTFLTNTAAGLTRVGIIFIRCRKRKSVPRHKKKYG
jgi:hypothetical protein